MNPIKQAIEALLYVRDCSYIDDNGSTALMKIYDPEHVDAALAALRSMPAEPVAWGMRLKMTGEIYDCITPGEHEDNPGEYTVPLYAIPHTAPVPLSDAEIVKIAREVLERQTEDGTPPAFQLAVGVARAIERAVLGRGEMT